MKKRTLKKLLSAVMAGTMAVGLLAGCSGGKEPEPKAES